MRDRVLIYVRQVVGPYCGGPEEGDQLRAYLETIWDRYEMIQLNFLGVETTSFRFFTRPLGLLFGTIPWRVCEQNYGSLSSHTERSFG